MAVVAAEHDKMRRKTCGYLYDASAGRVHGKHFMCQGCHNVENTIRRNLGDVAEMRSWSTEDRQQFFQKLQDEKQASGGSLQWKTIKAAMLTRLTEQHLKTFASQVEVEELPLSVYISRGWEADVVQKFPSQFNADYGCDAFKVPIRKLSWSEVFSRMEEKILEKEKEMKAKNKKTAEEMDFPLAAGDAGSASAETSGKKQAAAAKKIANSNERIANQAAKALGSLTSTETSLQKLLDKVTAASLEASPALEVCQKGLEQTQTWLTAARDAVNIQQGNRSLLAQGSPVSELTPLPFTPEDLKIALKTAAEGQKVLRTSLNEAKAAKAKAKGKESPKKKSKQPTDTAEAPKRKRGKTTP